MYKTSKNKIYNIGKNGIFLGKNPKKHTKTVEIIHVFTHLITIYGGKSYMLFA